MNLDLTKFKKIEQSNKHTLLEHPNGHKISIAHQGLTEKLRKDLDEMPIHQAKGGFSKYAQKFDPNIQKKASKMSGPSKGQPMATPKDAKNNYTEPQDQNLEPRDVVIGALNREAPPFGPLGTEEKQHYPPCINSSCKSFGKPHPNCRCYGGTPRGHEAGKFAEGGEVKEKHFCAFGNRVHEPECEYKKDEERLNFDDGGDVPSQGVPFLLQKPYDTSTPDQPTVSDVANESMGQYYQAPQNSMPSDSPQEDQSSQAQPSDQSAPTDESQMPIDNAPYNPLQAFQTHKQQNLNELATESAGFMNDLNMGHITPETYADLFNKKSTLGKIGTIFGLLIGGAGAGLAHQPNMLMEMMNREIQNDLQGQEKSAENRQNFLRINAQNMLAQSQSHQMDAETALKSRSLAMMNMNMAAFHNLSQMANDPKLTPVQRTQAQQRLAMVYQAMNAENSNIMDKAASGAALLKVFQGQNGQGGAGNTMMMKSGFLGPEAQKIGEDREAKTVPGLPGLASYPLGGAEKGELQNGMTFDRSINDLIGWAKSHPNGALPKSPEDQRGRALAGIVQGKFREATNGGVYKSGEQDFINKLIPEDPTKVFNAYRVLPKLQAVRQEMINQLDQKAKNYGFQGYPVRGKDGKMYVRSQSGSGMIPVK